MTNTSALQHLLAGFTSDPLTSDEAAYNSRALYNLLTHTPDKGQTRRHTVPFGHKLAEPKLGLRFGVNVMLINPASRMAFLAPHKHMAQLLPFGGQFDPADNNDPLVVGLREVLEESGVNDDETTSPLYMYKHALQWLPQPVLDVHTQFSDVPGKPEPWWFLTLGLCIPVFIVRLLDTPERIGCWYPLAQIARVPDVSLARAAAHALKALDALEA
jgi:hypothetical protein